MSLSNSYEHPWPSPTSPITAWSKLPPVTTQETPNLQKSLPSPKSSRYFEDAQLPELSNSRSSSMGQYGSNSFLSDRDTDIDEEMRYLGIVPPKHQAQERYHENPYYFDQPTHGNRTRALHSSHQVPPQVAHHYLQPAAPTPVAIAPVPVPVPAAAINTTQGRASRIFSRFERKSNNHHNTATEKSADIRTSKRQPFLFGQNKSSFIEKTPPRINASVAGSTTLQTNYAPPPLMPQYRAPISVASTMVPVTHLANSQPSYQSQPQYSQPRYNQGEATFLPQMAPRVNSDHRFPQKPPSVPTVPSRSRQIIPTSKPSEVQLRRIPLAPRSRPVCDDQDGHYIIEPGAPFADRYILVRLLGQGTFGKVAEAIDEVTQRRVAIKIIRAIPKYRDASKIELRVLTMLALNDTDGSSQCIQMLDCFDYRNHVCLVMELLDMSLYDFLKANDFAPFPSYHVQSFARQLFLSVSHLHKLGLIHTDIKPENILLESSETSNNAYQGKSTSSSHAKILRDSHITLIDFGSAVFNDEYHSAVVSTRHYRAPEIVLGTGWDFSCDMWSLGCLLIELCTGVVLYQTKDDFEHLHMMERTLEQRFEGYVAADACRNSTGRQFFDATGARLRPLTDKKQISNVHSCQSIRALVMASVPYTRERSFWDGFIDLLNRLLQLDPRNRLTADQAMHHPWISGF